MKAPNVIMNTLNKTNTVAGLIHGNAVRIAIVVSRFNECVCRNLLVGARETLQRHGVAEQAIDTVWVPGAFEIPLVAKDLAGSRHYDAVICLGAVIRGATAHFDYVCAQAAAGIMQAALQMHLPIVFGILTCDTLEQAIDRAGGKAGNKGSDAALTALEMVQLMRVLPKKAE